MRVVRTALAFVLVAFSAFGAGKAEHVVVVVWDGLRPDSVNERSTPTLHKLAREGVFFKNHHAVYLSSTTVNGAALATGAYPARTGIMANREYRPAIDPLKRVETESFDTVRAVDRLTGGRHVALPTIAEVLQKAGHKTAIVGTKPVTLLQDRGERADEAQACVTLFAGRSVPAFAVGRLTPLQSSFPLVGLPNTRQDAWTTQALVGPLWDGGVPKFSMLWLSEPDLAQHATGTGSDTSLAALKSSDDNLRRVLKELDARGVRDKTDVLVVSDHGFSTISRTVDVAAVLKKAGFNAAREFKQPPKDGEIMVVGNGGSVLLYVIGRDGELVRKLVDYLQQQDFVGVIFTREPMKGTFTLDQVRINTAHAPDLVVSLRWSGEKNVAGVEGQLVADTSTRLPGHGHHGSLSPFDMRTMLIAAGPDFRAGMVNQLPSGNADVAPTVLWILGVSAPERMDGRVLREALSDVEQEKVFPAPERRTLETTHEHGNLVWRQYLRFAEFGGAIYFVEGNGAASPKKDK